MTEPPEDIRDKRIEELFARVETLEHEIAALKDKPTNNPPAKTGPLISKPPVQAMEKAHAEEVSTKPITAPATKKPEESIENAIGTRWTARVGMLAILFGVAFFLKYSFDNELIGEAGRIILGILWGAAFIACGEYFIEKKRLNLYGQILSGGGLAVLYLSLYAGFALYHLIPTPAASAGMIAVTTTGMMLSIRYSAYSLSATALLGGFLTPIMLATGKNQPLMLFGYILLLDAGTLVVLHFRRWPSLVAASLLGTIIIYISWHTAYFDDSQQTIAFSVAAVFFFFYNARIILARLYSDRDESISEQSVILISAAFFFLAFFAQRHWNADWQVKTFTLALAAIELCMAQMVKLKAPSARLTIFLFAAVSVSVTVAATFLGLEQRWIMPALASEAAALAWIGFILDNSDLRHGAYLIGMFALFRFPDDLSFHAGPFDRFIPLMNSRFIACSAAICCFYFLLKLLYDRRGKLISGERYMIQTVFTITQGLSLALLSTETYDFFRFRTPVHMPNQPDFNYGLQLSLSVLWAIYGTLLTGAGIIKRIKGARILGILLLGVTIMKVFFIDLSALGTFYRIISFIVLGLLLLAVSYAYNRFKHVIFGEDLR